MDKNVYNMKAEKIQKQARRGDYETAAKICDTIDWNQVRSVRMLTLVSSVYEHVKEYDRAIDILLMAYEEAPVGKRFLYKLTELAIAAGSIHEAEEYYKSYIKDAGDDASRYLLRYQLAEAKGEPLDKRIAILETYRRQEFDEEWACRLAELYQKAGRREDCVRLCDEIILWFGVGPCVDRAMEIKEKYEPLTASQKEHREHREIYEEKIAQVARESEAEEAVAPAKSFASAVVPPQEPEVSEPGAESKMEDDDLPRVAISDDTPVEFDASAFISEEEEMQRDAESIFGETPASLDKTRQIVEGNDVSRTRVFEPVKEESEDSQKSGMPGETFSIGKFVESVMADAKKQENASTVLEDETAVDKKLLKKTVESYANAPAPSIFEELPEDGIIPENEGILKDEATENPAGEAARSENALPTTAAPEKSAEEDEKKKKAENAAAREPEEERTIEMPLSHMDRPQAAKIILRAPEAEEPKVQPEEAETPETAIVEEPELGIFEENAPEEELPEQDIAQEEQLPREAEEREQEEQRRREQLQREAEARKAQQEKQRQEEQLRRETEVRKAQQEKQRREEQLRREAEEREQEEQHRREHLQREAEKKAQKAAHQVSRELLYVGCSNAPDSLNMAVDALHQAYEKRHGELTQVAKISSVKLNNRGLVRSLSNLEGKDLIIDGASTLSDEILREIMRVREELDPDKYFVLLDRPAAIRQLKERMEQLFPCEYEEEETPSILADETVPDPVSPAPEVRKKKEPIRREPEKREPERRLEKRREVLPAPEKTKGAEPAAKNHTVYPADGELSEEQFAGWIRRYAESIDCAIDDGAMEAIYDVIDEILDDGDRLTRAVAEEVVEDAADEAERHSIRNVFGSRYDKDGKLILKARHFR